MFRPGVGISLLFSLNKNTTHSLDAFDRYDNFSQDIMIWSPVLFSLFIIDLGAISCCIILIEHWSIWATCKQGRPWTSRPNRETLIAVCLAREALEGPKVLFWVHRGCWKMVGLYLFGEPSLYWMVVLATLLFLQILVVSKLLLFLKCFSLTPVLLKMMSLRHSKAALLSTSEHWPFCSIYLKTWEILLFYSNIFDHPSV